MANSQKFEEETLEYSDSETKPKARRSFLRYFWPLPVEIAIILTYFANNASSVLYQHLTVKLTCSTIYGYKRDICDMLGTANITEEVKAIERIVQPYAANVMMVKMILDNVVPAIIGLFIGAWSDKFGRKPVLMFVMAGYLLDAFLATAIASSIATYEVSPWLFLLPSIPSALSGGICILLGTSYAYVADISSEENRSIRIAIIGFSSAIGLFTGLLCSSLIVEAVTPQVAFGISSIILIISLIYMAFVPESLNSKNIQKTSKFRGFFQFKTIQEIWKTFTKKRDNYDRMIIWICIAVLTGYMFAMEGPTQILFLYFRAKFEFTTKGYAMYNAIYIVTMIIGSGTLLVLLQRVLKIPMPIIILFGLASAMIDSIMKAAATVTWLLYLNLVITGGMGISLYICRALLSYVVPSNEIGKIYSLSTALEFISPLISAPIYTAVYNTTLDTFPEAFNLVSLAMFILCSILVIVLYVMDRRYSLIKIGDKQND